MSDLLNIGRISIPKITVGRENVSEISLGRTKLWPIDDLGDWTYEGVMTVGYYTDLESEQYGMGYGFGVIDPVNDSIDSFCWINLHDVQPSMIYVSLECLQQETILIKINNYEYTLSLYYTYDNNNTYTLDTSINPFPPVGQTCEIKLKYTLAEPEPEPQPAFPEVTIGTQTWMAVNLDIDDEQGGIYAYDNNEANVATYGRLYTWTAALRVAASIEGWHLPTDAEWQTLIDYLGGSVAGGKLKETGTTHWNSPNTGATNETGFTALPGGNRSSNGTFNTIGIYGYWWSATDSTATFASNRNTNYNSSGIGKGSSNKENGYSVRLIKDNS